MVFCLQVFGSSIIKSVLQDKQDRKRQDRQDGVFVHHPVYPVIVQLVRYY